MQHYLGGVTAGVEYVTGQRQSNPTIPAVANMSLGAYNTTDQTLENAITASVAAGVTYAIAAGNDHGSDACNNTPARAVGDHRGRDYGDRRARRLLEHRPVCGHFRAG